jgi:hypothetical protein
MVGWFMRTIRFRIILVWLSIQLVFQSVCALLDPALDVLSGLKKQQDALIQLASDQTLLRKHNLLNVLAQDMKSYKTTSRNFHAGNLFEHSMWVEQVIADWCSDEDNFWSQGVDERSKYLVALAGFLHDIGKAGDRIFIYKNKQNHVEQGFAYLMGEKSYRLKDGSIFDFDTLFDRLGLSEREKQLVTVLVGIHWDFGCVVVRNFKKNAKKGYKQFLQNLQRLVEKVGYNDGNIDEKLVRLAVLLGAADVKGSLPSTKPCTIIFSQFVHCEKVFDVPDKFKEFRFDTIGKKAREGLLNYFRKNWK